MPDREKVIRELINLPTTVYCGFYQLRITHDLRDETVELLKEQEAVKPILTPWIANDDGEVAVYKMECGKCGVPFYYEEQNYCSECGTPILWEGR